MNFPLLFHTLSHLRLKQVVYQLKYRLIKAKYRHCIASEVQTVKMLPWIDKLHCHNGEQFCFLNIQDKFTSWNDAKHGMLWAYNLNYMDYLLQADMTAQEGEKWIDKFIAELPTNNVGLDPYPIALRGINWIKFIIAHQSEIDSDKLRKWNDSLYSQYVLLTKKLEYHLLGNHLLEDAYSLYIAAIYFADEKFYILASKLLKKELAEQILPDGAHYEQSPMYHCILLDRLLDCYNISKKNIRFEGQEALNDFLRKTAVSMLGHLESICLRDESYPLFNDAALGIAPTPSQLKQYANRLALTWRPIPMVDCGYRKLNNSFMEVIVDVGNITATYQPAHTHADTFNYELRINGHPFIVDTGISTYNKTERRQAERSTSAHNTVTIEGKNSSEVWGGFRVGNRAKVRLIEDTTNKVIATHDGYGKRCLHERKFIMEEESLYIEDNVPAACEAKSHIHLAPGVEIITYNNEEVLTNLGRISLEGARSVKIEKTKVSHQYNLFEDTFAIRIDFCGKLIQRIEFNH